MSTLVQRTFVQRFFPLITGLGYFVFTFLVFKFGPWEWGEENFNQNVLVFFIAVALVLGFFAGQIPLAHAGKEKDIAYLLHLYSFSLCLMIVMSFFLLFSRTGGQMNLLWKGLTDPGYAYSQSRENVVESANFFAGLCEYFNILVSPVTILWLSLGIRLWKDLSRFKKIGYFFGMFFYIMPYIATGTNKGLFDLFFWIFWIWLALHPEKINRKILFRGKILVVVAVVAVICFSFFSIGVKGRYGGEIPFYNARAMIAYNTEYPVLKDLPKSMQEGVSAGLFYITQGYKGMSLCMDYEWVPMFGIGHSRFYTWLIGEKILQQTNMHKEGYCFRLAQRGYWDDSVLWSTIFPWLANDVSFWGIPVVMFFFSFFLALAWRDIIIARNKEVLYLFPIMMSIFFTLNMNNYIFQTADTAFSSTILFGYWLLNRCHHA